jgi:exodeoxyribonuclease VII large subunit
MEQPTLFVPPSITVSDITRYLRQLLESDDVLRDVWVLGEISNLSRPSSGHIYFTLKDSGAALRCVIWRTTAQRLRVDMQNGLAVEAHGYVSLYEQSGQYQLYVDALRPAGAGLLYQEFLRLKARLEAEGLFDEERKRPIPQLPRRIGIVTSPTGAALQDMLNTLRQRYRLAEVILSPAAVQGEEAPAQIAAAIRRLNRLAAPDVILVARGGGSLEDLWAFNDERVVRAIVASQAPVISGVGHETDFTLTDFAADLRAPTPTGAAVLAAPNSADLRLGLHERLSRLDELIADVIEGARRGYGDLRLSLERSSPTHQVQTGRQRLDELVERLQRGPLNTGQLRRARLEGAASRLKALDPLAVLSRGFAIVRGPDNRLVTSTGQLRPGDGITVRVSDGEIDAQVGQTRTFPDRGG